MSSEPPPIRSEESRHHGQEHRKPRVKICCISSPEEARMAVRWGASALGLVSDMPSGPGIIDEPSIAEIARGVPEGVATFLLTARTEAVEIAAQQRRTGANTLQLVDRVEASELDRLREALPGIALVQVIHVRDETAIGEARRTAPRVDAFLLDSGNPDLAIKELGGTGRVHDWRLSRRIVEAVDIPVYLAGGLNAANVGRAIESVGPYGLDLCSGVRTSGRLDEALLEHFMRAVGV